MLKIRFWNRYLSLCFLQTPFQQIDININSFATIFLEHKCHIGFWYQWVLIPVRYTDQIVVISEIHWLATIQYYVVALLTRRASRLLVWHLRRRWKGLADILRILQHVRRKSSAKGTKVKAVLTLNEQQATHKTLTTGRKRNDHINNV